MSSSSSKKSSRVSSQSQRSTLSLQKTEIVIHVYDLLPAGKLSSILWSFGTSLLHSGIVINGKEYAFGGHDKRDKRVYFGKHQDWNHLEELSDARLFRDLLFSPQAEIDAVIMEASEIFQGTSYNLLTRNCNHFTAWMCERLTGQSGPAWLNRAASIGVALPCMVPKEWITPPDHETADGHLIDDDNDERALLSGTRHSMDDGRPDLIDDETEWSCDEDFQATKGKGKDVRDTSGRVVPLSERAPTARR